MLLCCAVLGIVAPTVQAGEKALPSVPAAAPWLQTARSVTWGKWNWTPSPEIQATFAPENADRLARRYAGSGANVVFIDEHRYILVDEPAFQGYLTNITRAVEACHRHGLKVLLHLTVDGVAPAYAVAHPDQAVVDLETGGGVFHGEYSKQMMCPNNPDFQRAYCARVDALMKTGLDGLMPDETHWLSDKLTLCGCRHCREKFRKRDGGDLPELADQRVWGNDEQAKWRAWIDFRIRSQGDLHVKIQEVVRRHGADKITTACQCNGLDPYLSRHFGLDVEDMRRGLDASFYECEPGNPWSWRYNVAEAKYYTAFGPAFFLEYSGSPSQHFFSWAFALSNGLRLWTWPEVQGLEPFAFGWEQMWEELFIDPVPLCNVALLFSSPSKNLVAPALGGLFRNEYVGWAEAFTEAHVPFETLIASRLTADALRKYTLIVAPDVMCLSPREVALLKAYVAGGGTLVLTLESALYDGTGARNPDFALADVMGVTFLETTAAASLTFRERHAPGAGIRYRGRLANVKLTASDVECLATTDAGQPMMTSHTNGQGRVLYFAFAPGTQYFMPKVMGPQHDRRGQGGTWSDDRNPAHKALMLKTVDRARLPFSAEAPDEVLVHPFVHAHGGYRGIVVHLLNALGTRVEGSVAVPKEGPYAFSNYPPTGRITLRVRAGDIRRAYLISPDSAAIVTLPCVQTNGVSTVTVSSLERYACVYFVQSEPDAIHDVFARTPPRNGKKQE